MRLGRESHGSGSRDRHGVVVPRGVAVTAVAHLHQVRTGEAGLGREETDCEREVVSWGAQGGGRDLLRRPKGSYPYGEGLLAEQPVHSGSGDALLDAQDAPPLGGMVSFHYRRV